LVDPYAADAPNIYAVPPKKPPTAQALMDKLEAQRSLARANWRAAGHQDQSAGSSTTATPRSPVGTPADQRPEPTAEPATFEDILQEYNAHAADYNTELKDWNVTATRYQQVLDWINKSVSNDLLIPTKILLRSSSEVSIQEIVRDLVKQMQPTDASTLSTIRREYRAVLSRARTGRVNPLSWYQEWRIAFTKATVHKLPDVEGTLAITDFLETVAAKLAPDWASRQLSTVYANEELGADNLTVEEYGRIFSALAHESSLRSNSGTAPSFFATFGERSDDQTPSSSRSANSCPCLKRGATHTWEPISCARLEFAITGSTNRTFRNEMGPQEVSETRQRIVLPKWKWIVDKKNWGKHLSQSAPAKKGSAWSRPGRSTADSEPNFPGRINAAILDPELILESSGIYATGIDFSRHPLSASTLLDNCGAMHLVNDKSLLEPGSFKPAGPHEFVECGSSSLPITGRGKRVIKSILNAAQGPRTEDLELNDVAVVEGFHVNIVSEARLLKAGVWYHGLDCSLRFGTERNSVTLMELTRKYNLVFIEFKPLSTYLSVPSSIPTSAAGILMYPTMKRSVRRGFQRSRDYLKPRTDSEELWHLRAGHLGQKCLRALVYTARNVKIEGISRIQCEHCAITHAKQVISRRPVERKSPRPFWRVFWDLFDFPRGYNGAQWLLVLKDEYSGKLFGYVLMSKSLNNVFWSIKDFESRAKRQYGLAICKLKHDQEKGVIGINGWTKYELWAKEEGIDLELSPSFTHEPNGASERAGQEVITRSIKMRETANLPENLWPESTLAAIYLYNISPSEVHDMRTPNEVLDLWFRGYFRWYDPELITRITVDLRPDWNGIYAYGARAYPMIKEREAGRSRRAFKVRPRGHIGYLVGYSASNIYRIWVPKLDSVIVTRNVRFDETKIYSKTLEQLEGQPVVITRQVVEMIEETEIAQDAGSIIEHIDLIGGTAVENSEAPAAPILGGELPSKVQESQNSGVSGEIGLLTPERTPEPTSMQSGIGSGSGEQQVATATTSTAAAQSSAQLSGRTDTTTEARERRSVGGATYPQVVIYQSGDPPTPAQGNHSSRDRQERSGSGPSSGEGSRTNQSALIPTRASRRLRNQDNEFGTLEGNQIFATLAFRLNDLRDTFWPDHPLDSQEDHVVQAVHAVIAASVLQNRISRLGAAKAPGLPRVHQNDLPKAPKHWSELEKHPFGVFFIQDAETEIGNLESRNCWRVILIIEASSALIPLKWAFGYKIGSDGFVIRCRSRVVVRGDLQEEQTITSTYAATLAARSFRVAIAVAARFDLEIEQFDVVNAFVNAKRDPRSVPVACKLPDGFKQPGMCVEIDRALYGMRDSPALWYQEFTTTLTRAGLIPCKEEPCIFMDKRRKLMVVFYVDDVQVLYHRTDKDKAQLFISELKDVYNLHDLENIEWFLGVRVIRDRAARKIWLVHDTYIEKISKKFALDSWKCPSTPLPGTELVKNTGNQATPAKIKEYQEKVGSLLYTAIMIRPDVAFAAAQLSQFLTNPSEEHMKAVNWAIMYLWGTRFLAIQYGGEHSEIQELRISSDASFADDPETRRSSHGYIISLFGGPIIWKAARQPTVSTSTTQAELLAVEHTAKETMALQRFFKELHLVLSDPWTIFCDNQQTIRLIVGENERISTKLRHVDIQNMWLRQEHAFGTFEVTYLPTNDMPADGLTKNLPRYKFEHFRSLLNLHDVRAKIESIVERS
jgi:hypothetical protein